MQLSEIVVFILIRNLDKEMNCPSSYKKCTTMDTKQGGVWQDKPRVEF
jgi:hypothetical protein